MGEIKEGVLHQGKWRSFEILTVEKSRENGTKDILKLLMVLRITLIFLIINLQCHHLPSCFLLLLYLLMCRQNKAVELYSSSWGLARWK